MIRTASRHELTLLKFTELQAYLRHTGWVRADVPREDIALFQKKSKDREFETILPLSKDLGDYLPRIHEVIEAIALAEARPYDQVLTDLFLPPADILRFRLMERATQGGTIPLMESVDLLENAKKAIFTAACDLIQPERYHRRLSLKGAQQLIDQCHLGQTEHGSFVLSIICPFLNSTSADAPETLGYFHPAADLQASFTRRVTRRLMWSLHTIKVAIDRGEHERILAMDATEVISANLLESLLDLNTKENREVEISASWSGFAGPAPDLPGSVKFSSDYVPVMEQLIGQLRPSDIESSNEFVGQISQTKADPDPHTRQGGEIVLNYLAGDAEKATKARVLLSRDDYNQALEAHKHGKTVKVTGTMRQQGRTRVVEEARLEVVG